MRATTLLWDLISIQGLLAKLWGSKVTRDPNGAILGVLGKKSHLDVGFVANHKVYYKGEGGGFPQVRVVVSLVCSCCPWFVLAPKVFQLCTNHFVWVLCKPVWVSEACQLFLVPSRSSNTPLYPSKCCELGSVPRLLLLLLSSTWTHICILRGIRSVLMLAFFFLFNWHIIVVLGVVTSMLVIITSSVCCRLLNIFQHIIFFFLFF